MNKMCGDLQGLSKRWMYKLAGKSKETSKMKKAILIDWRRIKTILIA